MKKIKNIIIIIIAISIIAGLSYLGYSYYTTREQLHKTQQELDEVNNALLAEIEKCSSLNENLLVTLEDLDKANEIIAASEGEVYFVDCEVTNREIELLAKTVWGEARGCNRFEQSAVVWCILNRVDAGRGSIAQVITAPNQFTGYKSSHPVTKEIKELVKDVVARWKLEKTVCGNVGRTLPKDYLYFRADSTGIGNVFRNKYKGDYKIWNWDCWNPYK